jgi:hypothetical protein
MLSLLEIDMLRCARCKQDKNEELFSLNKNNPNGRQTWCKECFKDHYRIPEVRKKTIDRVVEWQRNPQNIARRFEWNERYRKTEGYRKKRSDRNRKLKLRKDYHQYIHQKKEKYKQDHPVRFSANHAVTNAVRDGKLIKPNMCFENNHECRGEIHGHHFDYSRPLEVIWLCEYHHSELHTRLRREKKGRHNERRQVYINR